MAPAIYILALATLAGQTPAEDTAQPAPEEAGAVEFVEGEGAAAAEGEGLEPMPLPVQDEIEDDTPPEFEDLAVAAGSPTAPARATAVVTDDASGIESVEIYYRATGNTDFRPVPLTAGEGGLFIAALPQGLNQTGFEYYAEAKDAAGNTARLGSPESPYRIKAVAESEMARVERDRAAEDIPPAVDPLWPAIALGAGVVGLAIGGYLWFDTYSIYNTNLVGVATSEWQDPTYEPYSNAMILNMAMAAPLTIVGLAGAGTGAGLLIFSALSE